MKGKRSIETPLCGEIASRAEKRGKSFRDACTWLIRVNEPCTDSPVSRAGNVGAKVLIERF